MTGGIEMTFERIDMEQWPRREHYRYYNEQIRTSYEMNVELDVTKLRKRCLKKGIHFYPAMMYAIMYSINLMRISEWPWMKKAIWAYMISVIRPTRFFTKMMKHFQISGQNGMRISAYFTKMSAEI